MIKYFSLVSGELYELPDDMSSSVDKFQIRLKEFPKNNCKKCYGRFYTSFNVNMQVYNICPSCARKILYSNIVDLTIETPKTTKDIVFE